MLRKSKSPRLLMAFTERVGYNDFPSIEKNNKIQLKLKFLCKYTDFLISYTDWLCYVFVFCERQSRMIIGQSLM